MDRRILLASMLSLGTALAPRRGVAQVRADPVRIGWLTAQRETSLTPYLGAMRAGLADAGYVEGRNLHIEYRYGDDAIDAVPRLAAELTNLPVAVLLVQGAAVQVVAKLGLSTPIVYVFSGDPVRAGLAESLAKPRANMTGLTFMAAELNGKRLEILRDIVPGLHRVAVIANPEHPGEDLERSYWEKVGTELGIETDYHATRTNAELQAACASVASNRPQAISVFADGFAIQNRDAIAKFAIEQRLPLISGWSVFAHSGALCTYGPRLTESYRRLAHYVERILKGAKPADLPIERPAVFELVLNQRTARAIGITLSPDLLVLADEVIE